MLTLNGDEVQFWIQFSNVTQKHEHKNSLVQLVLLLLLSLFLLLFLLLFFSLPLSLGKKLKRENKIASNPEWFSHSA